MQAKLLLLASCSLWRLAWSVFWCLGQDGEWVALVSSKQLQALRTGRRRFQHDFKKFEWRYYLLWSNVSET